MNKCLPPDSVASAIVKEYLSYKEHVCRQTYNTDSEELEKTSMLVFFILKLGFEVMEQ